ncbi:MAG: hypothetical protein PF690_14370 [Deltaproteobacteria bacterium]|nr:hypothetical protein [Deltaproteobacteria bacterium]
MKIFLFSCLLCALLLPGCSTFSQFEIKDLAKTNIDGVSETHMSRVYDLIKTLTIKLYKKNPHELQKITGNTINSRLKQMFICPVTTKYKELDFKDSTDAILLGFEPEFKGDRVFAMMYGLYTMIYKSYNSKCEIFMFDYLEAQNLYNSARNIEILVWRLKTRTKNDGKLFIITNSCKDGVENLSYERIFGKLISLQDTMAQIISNRSGRVIKQVVQIAGMAFLPIGI